MPTFPVSNDASFSRQIELTPEDERHLLKALRARPGEIVQVSNGLGQIARVKIASLDPLQFDVIDIRTVEKPVPLTLFLPLIDQDRMEWAVEKLTELNVAEIHLIATERCQSRDLKPAKFVRLKRTALAAQKQCDRAFPILIEKFSDLRNALRGNETMKLAASLNGAAIASRTDAIRDNRGHVGIFIGPEGGWSAEEESALTDVGVVPVNFGGTVLRSETAAVTAAAFVKLLRHGSGSRDLHYPKR